ncbi:hypothetical protein Tco_1546798 [Tanacetum coccineum]
MGVSHDLRDDSWGCVPRSLFWREDLDGDGERGLDCLSFALVSSKAHRKGCRASRGRFPYFTNGIDKAPTKDVLQSYDRETSLILNVVTKQHKEDCKQLFRLMGVPVIELVQDLSKHNDVESMSGAEDGTLDQHQTTSRSRSFSRRGRLLSRETSSAAP